MMNIHDEWQAALPELQLSVPFDLAEAAPLVFRVGSHSHGTYVPPEDKFGVDDLDLMVICIPPPEYVLGMKRWEHGQHKHGKLDVVFYDWSKWLRMMSKSNPNVLGTLWLENEDVLHYGIVNPRFSNIPFIKTLYMERQRFLSKRMYPAFVGYAKSQLHKMTHFVHEGYMGAKRKALVEQFGYDVKNAAHLIRLLRMACETLENARTIQVRRPDAAELIDIKSGRWSKEQVIVEAEQLFLRAERGLTNTNLPDEPDDLLIHKLMVAGYKEWWEWD